MSKLISPLLSLEARNQLGGAMVYKNRKGSNLVTAYSKPTGPPSAAQRAARVKYHSYTKEWQELYQARKDALIGPAIAGKRLSSFHQFMHQNLQSSRSTQSLYLDDCVGLWHINEGQGLKIYDATANHMDGDTHGPIWLNESFGPVLEMSKDDGCIEVGVHEELNLTDELTIKARFHMVDHVKEMYMFAKNGIAVNTMQYGMSITAAGRMSVVIDGTPWLTNVEPDHHVWLNMAITVKAGEYKKIYLNGILQDEAAQGSITPTSHAFYIGSRGGPVAHPADCFSGQYDELAIYNRILTEAEL